MALMSSIGASVKNAGWDWLMEKLEMRKRKIKGRKKESMKLEEEMQIMGENQSGSLPLSSSL